MSARPFARFASALALASTPISMASEVEVHLDIPVTDITVLQTIPVSVTVQNHGEDTLELSGDCFQHQKELAEESFLNRWTWLSVQITDPNGAILETDWTVLVPLSEESPHTMWRLIEKGQDTNWRFLLGVAWDTPEQQAIFDQPGRYSIAVIARGPGFEVVSKPVEVTVRQPKDEAAHLASELVRSLKGREHQLYYSTVAASQLALWVVLEGRQAAPTLFALTEDEHDHPYRNYASAALARGHIQAAIRFTLPHVRSKERATNHLAEASRLISQIGDQAPELRSYAAILSGEVKRLEQRNEDVTDADAH